MMAEENVRTGIGTDAIVKAGEVKTEMIIEAVSLREDGVHKMFSGTKENQFARRGDWVEIWKIIIPAGERAPQVPPDTAQVPLEMRLRGFLMDGEARLGQNVVVRTRINREVKGRLVDLAPSYRHNFGAPQPELLTLGQELREFLGRGQNL